MSRKSTPSGRTDAVAAASEEAHRRPELSRAKRILFLLVTFVLAFAVLELGLRLVTLFVSPSPHMRYGSFPPQTLRPGYEDQAYRINSLGYRGNEFSRDKQPGVVRIVCVGDSNTFGFWIPERVGSYPVRLAELLREHGAPGTRFEVINAGVPAFTSYDLLTVQDERVASLDPDWVLVMIGWNDVREENFLRPTPGPVRYRVGQFLNRAFYTLRFFKSLRKIGITPEVQRERVYPYDAELHEAYGKFRPERFEANLRRLIVRFKQAGDRVGLATLPHMLPVAEIPPRLEDSVRRGTIDHQTFLGANAIRFNQVIRQVAEEQGVSLVDLAREFDRLPQKDALFKFGDGSLWDGLHPNPDGAQLIAEGFGSLLVAAE